MTKTNDPPAMLAPDLSTAMKPAHDHGVEVLQFPDIPRLELDQLLEQLRDRADDVLATQGRLRGLLRANAAVAADLSLPALLRHIVDAARDLLHARYAAIVVLGDSQRQQFVHAGIEEDLLARINYDLHGTSVLDLLTANPDPDSADASPNGSGGFAAGQSTIGGFLDVPIQAGNKAFGNLYLRAAPRGTFSTEDEQLVTALAATAGVAIANARLLAESEQRRCWLAASSQLTNQLLAAEIEQPLACVTQAAMTAADADFATLTVVHSNDEVMVAAATGASAAVLVGRKTAIDSSRAGQTIRTSTPVLLADCRVDSEAHTDGEMTIGPMMIVPLSAGAHIRGAVTIGRLAGRDGFTGADLDMAVSFGTHAAVALALAEARDTQINDARLDDRDRLAFDMHDHVMGELFALGMGLQGLAAATHNPAQVRRITTYIDTLDRVISTIRTMIFELQPHRQDPAGPIDSVVDEPLAADILAVTR